jgi:hypothetical protein
MEPGRSTRYRITSYQSTDLDVFRYTHILKIPVHLLAFSLFFVCFLEECISGTKNRGSVGLEGKRTVQVHLSICTNANGIRPQKSEISRLQCANYNF